MNRLVQSLLLRCFAAAAAIGLCAAPGCPFQYEWQGPSTGFKGADFNGDGAIDQMEREWIYGPYRDVLSYYRVYDCDRDGRITWHEHFEFRFKNRACPGVLMPTERDVPAAVQKLSPMLTMPHESVVHSSRILQVRRPAGSRPPPLRNEYSESDPTPDQRAAVTLTSGAIEPVRIDPAQVPGLQAPEPQAIEPASRLQCRVINDSKNFRVRLADLDIEWTNEEPDAAPMTRGYLKTLSLEPGSATDILAWFPAEVREARCRLRGVRGQPAGWLP